MRKGIKTIAGQNAYGIDFNELWRELRSVESQGATPSCTLTLMPHQGNVVNSFYLPGRKNGQKSRNLKT